MVSMPLPATCRVLYLKPLSGLRNQSCSATAFSKSVLASTVTSNAVLAMTAGSPSGMAVYLSRITVGACPAASSCAVVGITRSASSEYLTPAVVIFGSALTTSRLSASYLQSPRMLIWVVG